jgi:hypothetical protein
VPETEASIISSSQSKHVKTRRQLRRTTVVVAALGLTVLVAAAIGYKTRDALVSAAEALIWGIPIAAPQVLAFADLAVVPGTPIVLFNGADLKDWEGWLGYSDPAETYKSNHSANPIGVAGIGDDFEVVVEDGEPAIHIKGKTWGGLTHKGDFGDYHLSLQFKWGKTRYFPKLQDPRDSGLFYHSHGPPGGEFGTWMRAIDFDIINNGQVGRIVPVGRSLHLRTTIGRGPDLFNQRRRYMIGGREIDVIGGGTWFVQNATDQEKPAGDWNTLDLYVLGDRAIHVVNGVPVLEAWNICDAERTDVRCEPLTHGRIQLQSEGSETFFRHIALEPIKSLPRVRATP